MTRMINADVLIDKYQSECSVDVFRYEVIEDLRNAPTVDAIPVAWIEQYGKANWYDFGTQYNAITKMLEEWKRKEE